MSMAGCDYCGTLIDTDADPDSCTDNGKFMCESCRYEEDEESDQERCLRAFEHDGGGCICGAHQLIRRQPDVGIMHAYLE